LFTLSGPKASKRAVGHLTLLLARRYPRQTALVLVAVFLSGILEGIGIATLLPILDATQGNEQTSELTKIILTPLHALGVPTSLPWLLMLLTASMVLKSVLTLWATRLTGHASAKVAADLRRNLISALMQARWNHFVQKPSADLQAAIAQEALWAASAYSTGCGVAISIVQASVYGILSLLLSWQATLLGGLVGAIVFGLLHRLVRQTEDVARQQTYDMRALMVGLSEVLLAIKPLKAMACEQWLTPVLMQETGRVERAQRRIVDTGAYIKVVQEPVAVILIALAMYVGVTYFNTPLLHFAFLALVFYRLATQVGNIQASMHKLTQLEGGGAPLIEATDEAIAAHETAEGSGAPRFESEIALESVSFRFGERTILDKVNVIFRRGLFTALTGPSGAGKTTVTDIVLGLHEPQEGSVLIDGAPLTNFDRRAWRSMIGYVPQEIMLLNASVRDNVTLQDPSISREAVEVALRAAEAWEFVEKLPQGIDTPIGERGGRLSGGQRQRIAIARALVRSPRLLILDEMTAALDLKTAMEICSTLRRLTPKVAIIAVSHQSEVVDFADAVYEVRDCTIRLVRGAAARAAG